MCTALQFSIYVAKCSKLSVTDLFTLMENLNHWALIPNEFKHERELLVELEEVERERAARTENWIPVHIVLVGQ